MTRNRLLNVVILLCLKEFQLVAESVMKIQTFKRRNITSFVRLGKYLFMLFLLNSFSVISFGLGQITTISISFIPLVLMLLAFVMAEIFKEGNQLMKENQLTI